MSVFLFIALRSKGLSQLFFLLRTVARLLVPAMLLMLCFLRQGNSRRWGELKSSCLYSKCSIFHTQWKTCLHFCVFRMRFKYFTVNWWGASHQLSGGSTFIQRVEEREGVRQAVVGVSEWVSVFSLLTVWFQSLSIVFSLAWYPVAVQASLFPMFLNRL